MVYGYVRVSTTEQNLDRQIEAFKEIKIDKMFSDKCSGKDFNREQYLALKKQLKQGDILFIKSIDRLGRNYDMIIDEWREITTSIGADIVVIDMPLLDTRQKEKGLTGKFISDLVLQILSYVAEVERNNIKQRQAEGIAIAKAKGVHMGRPKFLLPNNFKEVFLKYKNKVITLPQACEELNMKKATFYKYYNIMKPKPKKCKPQKCKYHLFGYGVDKFYNKRKDLIDDLKITYATLRKHLIGKFTIIKRLGLSIEME